MELLTFKTLWGHPHTDSEDSLARACDMAVGSGFDGIEGPIPVDGCLRDSLALFLKENNLDYIAEVCTAGSYVPNRTASVALHLQDLAAQLKRLTPLSPLLVNCIGGCDRWDLETSLYFFDAALEIADKAGVRLSFETHRGRSLYSPWMAEKLLEKRPLPLTCDFSHWCVVCEGLGESEDELLREVARHAVHIHARVGYDQGPQVPDPASLFYQQDLQNHLRWWRWIWQSQKERGFTKTTATPEFGPDGYQMMDPQSGRPVGDLNAMNSWMAAQLRRAFVDC